ncbi:N-6 DNA methylase [Methanolobus sp. WCC1]|uniref:N-6 DNA methylase n=1 Tax=unclassified Methanolobus TaxID=2629569 RepID=UPI0032451FA3
MFNITDKIECLKRKREINATKEELVRQSYLGNLFYSLKYPESHIDVEVSIQDGSTEVVDVETNKKKRADIVVYDDAKMQNIKAIIEVKKNKATTGEKQVKSYGNVTNARYLVWHNGVDTKIWMRVKHKNTWKWNKIPLLPRFGHEHGDVIPTLDELDDLENSIGLFKSINDFIWVNSNIKNKKSIFLQFLYILFIKLYDEMYNAELNFYILESEYKEINDSSSCLSFETRIKAMFNELKQSVDFATIFDDSDKIELEPSLLAEIVYRLQYQKIRGSDKKGEAFQLFISPYYRGENDQYLTPEPIIEMILDIVKPTLKDVILDPACGSGRFLTHTINHLSSSLSKQNIDIKNWASSHVFGIDVEKILVKISKLYMVLIGDGHTNILCENSIRKKRSEFSNISDISTVITNPPFGSSEKINEISVLENYELGHAWDNNLNLTGDIIKGQSQGILMLEKSYHFLRDGGKIGIVLPEGVFSNLRDNYIRKWIVTRFNVLAIVSLPEETFRVKTIGANVKTSVLIAEKKQGVKTHNIFFAMPNTIGYNLQGEKINSNEVSDVSKYFETNKQIENKYFTMRLSNEQLIDRMDASYYSFQMDTEDTFQLGDLCDVFIGKTPTKKNYLDKGNIKILKVRCLTNRNVDWSDKNRDYVTERWYKSKDSESLDIKKNDIILASAAHVAKYIGDEIDIVDYIPDVYDNVIASAKIAVIRVNNIKILNPYVLLLYLRTDEGYQQIQSIVRGQTAEIYPQDVLKLRLPNSLKEISQKTGTLIQEDYENALKMIRDSNSTIDKLEESCGLSKHSNILHTKTSQNNDSED